MCVVLATINHLNTSICVFDIFFCLVLCTVMFRIPDNMYLLIYIGVPFEINLTYSLIKRRHSTLI